MACPKIFVTLLAAAVMTCSAKTCSKEVIRGCLDPVEEYLVKENMGQSSKSLLQAAIEHFFKVLDNQQSEFIHIASLNTILKQVDRVFLTPSKLPNACRVFSKAKQCVGGIKEWCHGETRDDLEGIENIFNYICDEQHQEVFKSNYKCLADNKLSQSRQECDQSFQSSLNAISKMFPSFNMTVLGTEGQDKKETTNYDVYNNGISIHAIETYDTTHWLQSKVCPTISTGLLCYKGTVEAFCNSSAAEWSYNLRHNLVQLLLYKLTCEEYEGHLSIWNDTDCFLCADKSSCVAHSQRCNSVKDCTDGSDEDNCGIKVVAVVLGVAAAVVVLILIAVCVVKCQEEASFSLKRSRSSSTEMMSITQQEAGLGDSTPPVVNGKPFTYKPVPTTGAASNA